MRKLGIRESPFGAFISGDRNAVADVETSGCFFQGVSILGDENVVEGSRIIQNDTESVDDGLRAGGMYIGGRDNVVKTSTFARNDIGFGALRDGGTDTVLGPYNRFLQSVTLSGQGTSVRANRFTEGGSLLSEVFPFPIPLTDVSITGNLFRGGGHIEVLDGSDVVVRSNTVSGADTGLVVQGGSDITLTDNVAGARLATSGRVTGNVTGISAKGVNGLALTGNAAHHNSGDGIDVTDSTKVAATANAANYNGGDGMSFALAPGATGSLRANGANHNGGRGIVAGPGFADLGGNRALGNLSGQCVGVAC